MRSSLTAGNCAPVGEFQKRAAQTGTDTHRSLRLRALCDRRICAGLAAPLDGEIHVTRITKRYQVPITPTVADPVSTVFEDRGDAGEEHEDPCGPI